MEGMLKFSPSKLEGSVWDEGGKTEIVQFLISYNEIHISSIQFVYVVDGNVLRSEIHGEIHNKESFAAVRFDYPREYLVSVSGWHKPCNGDLVSISFGTNKRTYGPFGRVDDPENERSKFAYHFTPKSSFGGFHGFVKDKLLCIGVYIRPVGSLAEIMTNIKDENDQSTSSKTKGNKVVNVFVNDAYSTDASAIFVFLK